MKILVTTPYESWPVDFGGAVRTVNLVRTLAKLGHEVVLLTASSQDEHGPVEKSIDWRSYPSGNTASHFYNYRFSRELHRAVREQPDLIVAEFPYQARMIIGPARKADIPVIYDAHNIEADRFRKMGRPAVSLIVRHMESYLCRHADRILVTSESDNQLLGQYYGKSGMVLPNGVEINRFIAAGPDSRLMEKYGIAGNKVALFFGTLNYGPNTEALAFLLDKVWPTVTTAIPEAKLLVVGRNPPDWVRGNHGVNGVVVTGAVEDIAGHICLANIVLAPLFSGGGTRLKIIEALACGQTVLSTPFGAEGLATESSPALILADRDQFATQLISSLQQENAPCSNGLSRQMAEPNDWSRIVSEIDWEALARRA